MESLDIKINKVCLILLIGCVLGFGLTRITCFSLFPDEFGYYAFAAKMVGYDWIEIASLGSYYSYGYGLLLTPILWLFEDGILVYRIGIVLNALLLVISFWLLNDLLKRLFKALDEWIIFLASGTAILYPGCIMYMQMCMTEVLLTTIFILIVYILVRFVERPDLKKAILLGLLVSYMYNVHLRTVGIVISLVLSMTVWMIYRLRDGSAKKDIVCIYLAFILAFVVSFALGMVIKEWSINNVFGNASKQALDTNLYAGGLKKLEYGFSKEGIIILLEVVCGQVLYFLAAGFGQTFFSVLNNSKFELKLFLGLSAVSELLISSVYLVKTSSYDGIIYGRYIDFLMPLLIAVGICSFSFIEEKNVGTSKKDRIKRHGILLGVLIVILIPVILWMNTGEHRNIRGYMLPGLSHLIPPGEFNPVIFAVAILLWGVLTYLLILAIVNVKGRFKKSLITAFLILELVLGLHASDMYPYRFNETHFIDVEVSDRIKEYPDIEVYYLKENAKRHIDSIQMMLGERTVHVINENELENLMKEKNNIFLITVRKTKYKEELMELYDHSLEVNSFMLFDNN